MNSTNPVLKNNTPVEEDRDDVSRIDKEHIIIGCASTKILIFNISNYSNPIRVFMTKSKREGSIESVRVSWD